MDDLDQARQQTRMKMDLVRGILRRAGLNFVDLECVMGSGVGVPFDPQNFVIVSAMHFGDAVNIAVPVLKDLNQDRLPILTECNRLTQNNPAYPFYLHDAEVGWAVLVAAVFPTPVLARVEDYAVALARQLPGLAKASRERIAAVAGGRPFSWPEDVQEMLLRSLM